MELARSLAAGGWSVTRPDLLGTGDAAGDHGDATLAIWREQIDALPATVLIGVRLGGALAWLAAGDRRAEALVLIEPVVSGASYLRQCRQRSAIRRELTAGDRPAAGDGDGFDFDGFAVSATLKRELGELDLLTAPLPAVGRLLVVQVSAGERIKKPYEDLLARARGAGIDAAAVNVAAEPFWSSIGLVDTAAVNRAILDWLGLAEAVPGPVVMDPSPERVVVAEGVTARPVPLEVDGTPLAGLLYEPAAQRAERLVVLLHGWSGYRVGPGRLLTETARALAGAGCAALSFDFRGRGDSGGEVGATSLATMIADAVALVPRLLRETGVERCTLLGLCSGSEVALGAALSDPRIDSLVLWSAPIFGGELTLARRARRGRSAALGYARKLIRLETWKKLIAGRLNWKLIRRALGGGRSSESVEDAKPDPAAALGRLAEYRGRLLLVHGGGDPETAPSVAFYRPLLERLGLPCQFVEIAGANHNFYALEWKRELISTALGWLAEGERG